MEWAASGVQMPCHSEVEWHFLKGFVYQVGNYMKMALRHL